MTDTIIRHISSVFLCVALLTVFATLLFGVFGFRSLRGGKGGGSDRLDVHMAKRTRSLFLLFFWAAMFWGVFYVFLYLDPSYRDESTRIPSWIVFGEDLCTNVTSVLLLGFYVGLSATSSRGQYGRSGLWSWIFLLAALMMFEGLRTFTQPSSESAHGMPLLGTVYGLGQGVVIYMIAGRLDSRMMSKHALIKQHPRFHRLSIFVAYLYASIQPLYVLLGGNHRGTTLILVLFALVFKVWLGLWIYRLLTARTEDQLSPIEHLAYEIESFSVEEESEFESTFLRKHFRPAFVREVQEKKTGYLGIEQTHLNEFKREWMGLRKVEGGLLVRRVYGRSDALRKGIRPWDFVVSVNGMPVGPTNSLSEVLAGTNVGSEVEVELFRKRTKDRRATEETDYTRLRYRVTLGDYSRMIVPRVLAWPKLGATINGNCRKGGVMCKWGDKPPKRVVGIKSNMLGRYFEVPDASMLRLVAEQLVAGDTIEVFRDFDQPELPFPLKPIPGCTRPWVARDKVDPGLGRRLATLYPDRLADPFRPEMPGGRESYLMFFDASLALLLECTGDCASLDVAQKFEFWERVDASPVHVFVGQRSVQGDDVRFCNGMLHTFDLGPPAPQRASA